ncbi:hypothetical protein LTR85_004521 [Meristemomyces frigidus]|nr:hypothetical protein LTR85_004521 [Meristemomyces frigidus]
MANMLDLICARNLTPSKGAAILIGYEGVPETEDELGHLEWAFDRLQFNIYNMRVAVDVTDESALAEFRALATRVDGKGKLTVVCFAGHGASDDKRLYACKEDKASYFDFSALQELARDELRAHFLFVVDCCYSGLRIPRPAFRDRDASFASVPNRDHTVEIVSSGGSKARTNPGLSRRAALAFASVEHSVPCSVKDLFDRLISCPGEDPPGRYRLVCGLGSSMLQQMPLTEQPLQALPGHALVTGPNGGQFWRSL